MDVLEERVRQLEADLVEMKDLLAHVVGHVDPRGEIERQRAYIKAAREREAGKAA